MTPRESLLYMALAIGAFVTLGFMVYAGQPDAFAWFVDLAPFMVWVLAPFVAAGLAGRLLRSSPASLGALLVFAVGMVLVSTVVLYRTMVLELDAQGGLIFLSLPAVQLIALVPFVGAAIWLRVREVA